MPEMPTSQEPKTVKTDIIKQGKKKQKIQIPLGTVPPEQVKSASEVTDAELQKIPRVHRQPLPPIEELTLKKPIRRMVYAEDAGAVIRQEDVEAMAPTVKEPSKKVTAWRVLKSGSSVQDMEIDRGAETVREPSTFLSEDIPEAPPTLPSKQPKNLAVAESVTAPSLKIVKAPPAKKGEKLTTEDVWSGTQEEQGPATLRSQQPRKGKKAAGF